MFLAKDFIETPEGLIFAVVESGIEKGKILCFLRYIQITSEWSKVDTEQANQLLGLNYPQFLHYSFVKQAHLHGVKLDEVYKHYQPRKQLQKLLQKTDRDNVENDLYTLCFLFKKYGLNLDEIGITGSIQIGAHKQSSDIDLVFYSRDVFNQAREITRVLIQRSDCTQLNETQWKESWERRSCDLSYSDYLWHEKRKYNKAIINQRKFDLSLVSETARNQPLIKYKKLGSVLITVQITDDTFAYDYPAEFFIDHEQIKSIVCYTATYSGQAVAGEWVEVAGMLEQSDDGVKRIFVGSNREAKGEYIKVSNAPSN